MKVIGVKKPMKKWSRLRKRVREWLRKRKKWKEEKPLPSFELEQLEKQKKIYQNDKPTD